MTAYSVTKVFSLAAQGHITTAEAADMLMHTECDYWLFRQSLLAFGIGLALGVTGMIIATMIKGMP